MAENFAVFDESTANDLLATMSAIKNGGLLDPKQDETKRGLDGRKVENTPIPTIVYNTSGQVVPAYGLMQVIGNLDEDGRNYVTIKRPADSVPPGLLLVNGSTEIAIAGYGIAQVGPTYRLLHDGGTYAAGYTLGINIGAFTATAGHMFSVLGDDELTSGTDNVVRVMFADPTRLVLAYTTGGATARSGTTLGKGTATMRYLAVSGTDRVLTATTDTAPIAFYNLAATSVGANKYLMLLRFGDILLANWEEC
tara:strand:- start:3738 stop:4493 length:756 start_codon:yes stop_codon:yes gene_type:complete